MRIVFIVLAALLAGCAGDVPGADSRDSTGAAAATIKLVVIEDDGEGFLEVALTNEGRSTLSASRSGFRMVDANGKVTPPFEEGMRNAEGWAFPRQQAVGAGETLEGALVFDLYETVAPYVLKYEYGGARADVALLE